MGMTSSLQSSSPSISGKNIVSLRVFNLCCSVWPFCRRSRSARGAITPSGVGVRSPRPSFCSARDFLSGLVLALVLLAGLSACAEASGGRIAFQTYYDGSYQIGVIGADGGNLKELTDFTDNDSTDLPVFSPDGHRLLTWRASVPFQISGEILGFEPRRWIMSDEGTEVGELGSQTWSSLRVYSGEISPSWSPDGRAVLFARFDEEGYSIVQVNTDGSGETVIVPPTEEAMAIPVYSPDGSKIAYSRGNYLGRQIHIVNADGTDDETITHENGDVASLSWAPNGREILFSVGERSHSGTSIDIINADGTGSEQSQTPLPTTINRSSLRTVAKSGSRDSRQATDKITFTR